MLLKYNMLLGNATKPVVSLWTICERESCFLLPPPQSHFSLHNINSFYFMSKAKRQRYPMCYPSALRSTNYKGSWKELAVPLHPEEGNPVTDKPREGAAGAYLLGRMNGWDTSQGAGEMQYSVHETFTLVEGLMKRLPKGWWGNGGQERNRGRQPFLQGICSFFFFLSSEN